MQYFKKSYYNNYVSALIEDSCCFHKSFLTDNFSQLAEGQRDHAVVPGTSVADTEKLCNASSMNARIPIYLCDNLCICCASKCMHESNKYVCLSKSTYAIVLNGRGSECWRENMSENKGLKEHFRVRQMHKVSVNRSLLRKGHLCIVC